jgi:hypothetical protein
MAPLIIPEKNCLNVFGIAHGFRLQFRYAPIHGVTKIVLIRSKSTQAHGCQYFRKSYCLNAFGIAHGFRLQFRYFPIHGVT